MKSQGIVSAVVLVAMSMSLTCCEEYKPVTSHFGHGFYQCYYQNTRTGQFYKGMDDTEKYATRAARRACSKAAIDHNDKARCQFAECLFK